MAQNSGSLTKNWNASPQSLEGKENEIYKSCLHISGQQVYSMLIQKCLTFGITSKHGTLGIPLIDKVAVVH